MPRCPGAGQSEPSGQRCGTATRRRRIARSRGGRIRARTAFPSFVFRACGPLEVLVRRRRGGSGELLRDPPTRSGPIHRNSPDRCLRMLPPAQRAGNITARVRRPTRWGRPSRTWALPLLLHLPAAAEQRATSAVDDGDASRRKRETICSDRQPPAIYTPLSTRSRRHQLRREPAPAGVRTRRPSGRPVAGSGCAPSDGLSLHVTPARSRQRLGGFAHLPVERLDLLVRLDCRVLLLHHVLM